MTLTYEATLNEAAEPSVRLFARSRTYATNRWRGSLLCAAIFAVFAFLGFHSKPEVSLVAVCLAAAAWGAGLFLLTYKGSVRRRIVKYLADELKGDWPRTTTYVVQDGKLVSTTSGVSITFTLADLTGVSEDATYLELSFATKGLCTIPLRAFASAEVKSAFLAAIGHTSLSS